MTLDEQLRRTFDTLADRLRAEVARELQQVASEMAVAAQADREQAAVESAAYACETAEREFAARLPPEVAAAETRGREQVEAQARQAIAETEQRAHDMMAAAVAAARADIRSADLAASERLVDAIRAIDRARSLSEILDALVSCAGREAARAGALLVRGGQLRGWRFIGFGSAFEAASSVVLPVDGSGVIAEAVRTGTAASADAAGGVAPPFAGLPDGRDCLAVPIPMSGQVVAVLYVDQGAVDGHERALPLPWPDTIEVLARHAARCLEAVTAFRAARGLTERLQVPSLALSDPASRGQESRVDDDEEAARRYARLLVSEIKLYHEAAVVAGRRERDLATRLGEEIARARVLYEQRVPTHLRQRTDHFHAELVRTLANGDASLLGQTA